MTLSPPYLRASHLPRQHPHPDAPQHRGQRQGEDQPDHRLAQRVATLVVRRVPVVVFVVHHIGPKKVLSTVSLASPSTLRMVKTTSCRPLIDAGALSTTGSASTSSVWARTGCGLPRSTVPGVLDSISMGNERALATFLTSLTRYETGALGKVCVRACRSRHS